MALTNKPLEDPPVHYCPRCRDDLKLTVPAGQDLYWCESCHIMWEVRDYPDVKTWGENIYENKIPGARADLKGSARSR